MFVEVPEEAIAASRQLNDVVETALATMPSVHTVDVATTREQQRRGGGLFPAPVRLQSAQELSAEGPLGGVPLRVLRGETVDAVYLHFHGGGWTIGAADIQDERLQELADRARVAIVSVEYRLAPENPHPAAVDDAETAARWVIENGLAEFGTDRLVIGGESAGAHLAVLALLRLRDSGLDVGRFLGANLVFGCYDLGGTPSQRRWGERNLILSGPIIDWFLDGFTPGLDAEARRDPSISPLYADLSGLPPALFTVGTSDPLLDDSLFMAARWQAAGNPAELAVYPEAMHSFTSFPIELGGHAQRRQEEFVARCMGAHR